MAIANDPTRYAQDTIWSSIALAIQVASGAVLTIGLFIIYGSSSLGVFNQLYAIFIISGQLFVFGLNDSALKHSAEFIWQKRVSTFIGASALMFACLFGVIGTIAMIFFSVIVGAQFFTDSVHLGVLFMSPGLALFVFNKVIQGLLNGQQQFRPLAFVQSLRAILLVSLIFLTLFLNFPFSYFGLCISITELAVTLSQLGYIATIALEVKKLVPVREEIRKWISTHLKFGALSMPHGVLSESFIRVDILVLAFFLTDKEIGVYSFAAFFVEGIYQIPVIIRNVTNPRLARIFTGRDRVELFRIVIKSSVVSFLLTASLTLLALLCFHITVGYLEDSNLKVIFNLLQIIFPGLIIYSLFIPFDYSILQAGRPGLQSIFVIIVVMINLTLNILLINSYGLVGAAIATTVSFICAGPILVGFSHRAIRLWTWNDQKDVAGKES